MPGQPPLWADVANPPALDLTTRREQVILPTTGSSSTA